MATYERNVILETGKYDSIGKRPIRHDGADKVTGRAKYGADYYLVGTLHAKVLRSPHAHARIISIDTSKAENHPNVRAVVTAADLPTSKPGGTIEIPEMGDSILKYLRGNILASDKVVYKGHAVAAVAATDPHEAEEALKLIDVQYEPLPPILTAPDGMAKNAPIIHDDLETKELGKNISGKTNISVHLQDKLGDVQKGFSEADVVIEREFNTATVHQGYIEPHNVTALWNKDGRVSIWCSTQGSFTVRDTVAAILDLPVSQVKVTPMEIGGGFGGKIPVYVEPIAALLSKKTGLPVKNVMTRTEVFDSTGPTPGSYVKIKIGAKNTGEITAAQVYMTYEAGGFPGGMIEAGTKCVFAAYDVPNLHIDGYDVVVNKPKTAAYRAPGATNAAFATESVVTEIAETIGMDPIDFRLKNAAKEGTRKHDGTLNPKIGCIEVLEAMKNHPHYQAPLEENVGRGIAIGYWFNVGLPSCAQLNVNTDGIVSLIEGSTDIGGTRTSLSQQAAEVLGIPVTDILPSVVDTDSIGFTGVTGGSRTTYATGWAVYKAAQDVVNQMIERAAKLWGIDIEDVSYNKGTLTSENGDHSISFKELAAELNDTGGPIAGNGAVNPKTEGASYAGNIVDVKVDPETGKVDVVRFTVVQDAGKAIHPSYVEGQMQGGSTQGIGWGLNEEYFMTDEGRMANSTLLDYRMPISMDVPLIDTVIVEVPNPGHPFGVRGVGEANIVPPPAALAHAIYSATGFRPNRLPMSPPNLIKVWGNNNGK